MSEQGNVILNQAINVAERAALRVYAEGARRAVDPSDHRIILPIEIRWDGRLGIVCRETVGLAESFFTLEVLIHDWTSEPR